MKNYLLGGLAAVGAMAFASAAFAGSGGGSATTNLFTIFQTNTDFSSSSVTPVSSPPVGAVISDAHVIWKLNRTLSAGQTQFLALCNPVKCSAWKNVGAGGGGTAFFTDMNGIAPGGSYVVHVDVTDSTTHTISPSLFAGGEQVVVNYTF